MFVHLNNEPKCLKQEDIRSTKMNLNVDLVAPAKSWIIVLAVERVTSS